VDLFDAHLHLDDEAFAADRDSVVARAVQAGIIGMVTAGSNAASSRAAVAFAERTPGLYAAVGIHPHEAAQATPEAMADLRALGAHPKVVAVGETGLDYAKAVVSPEVQQRAFVQHIRLSRALEVPLVVHCRDAYPQLLELLAREQARRVIMHAFSGSVAIAQECTARGYLISLAGPVTFRRAEQASAVAQHVPEELLLVESDAPVLAPEPFRGRRNEPAYLVHTVRRIAALRKCEVEEIAATMTANAKRIYAVA
jgi:TatD DNase family protein